MNLLNPKGTCFVLMPFNDDLFFFYEFLKKHLDETYSMNCFRASEKITNASFFNKIKRDISRSDIIIADCTGNNPNVFYELGLAHCQGKKVIHITQDKFDKIPSDNRHREFIKYEKGKKEEFLNDLDKAIKYFTIDMYDDCYNQIKNLCDKFELDKGVNLQIGTKHEVIDKIKTIERSDRLPPLEDYYGFAGFAINKIINSSQNSKSQFINWLFADKYEQLSW